MQFPKKMMLTTNATNATTTTTSKLAAELSLYKNYNTPFPFVVKPLFTKKPSFPFFKPFSSLKTTQTNQNPPPPNSPWLQKWPPMDPPPPVVGVGVGVDDPGSVVPAEPLKHPRVLSGRGFSAIDRIVGKLRNLSLDDGDGDGDGEDELGGNVIDGDQKLGNLLRRDWIRGDEMLVQEKKSDFGGLLPWERDGDSDEGGEVVEEVRGGKVKRTRPVQPTMAEKTLEEAELKRLRGLGMRMRLKDKVNVAKAGVTRAVVDKIHAKWRKSELVRLKFHEDLARDMKTGHILVERRTGGLVIWRSGSVMVVYRGKNYNGPPLNSADQNAASGTADTVSAEMPHGYRRNLTAKELEYNELLDGLGPRFVDWWGTGVLPIDADRLPRIIPDFKPPLRLMPVGMRRGLTNEELTKLRKQTKALPCHFALGRNRNNQGLAAAIIKLWERSIVAKIAVKRGVQNTNNEMMSEELKRLTGGSLLLRNKYFIVLYRGKDFLPPSVAATVKERMELTKSFEDAEEKARSGVIEADASAERAQVVAGTLAEYYQAQARWGREVLPEEYVKMRQESFRAQRLKDVQRIEHKLALAQTKKLRAEKLLSKVEASMVPVGPSDDQETITDEERITFRRIGLRMKAYLPVGIRGIFDGVIENMHLHWKHRELVKLISKQKNLTFVEETARLLEYESGGILVTIERVTKGYALIYYRGKNYQRPISLRPRNLLTKAKAFKRAIAMQRHEALSQHISELEKNITEMRKEMGSCKTSEDENDIKEVGDFSPISEFQSEDEDSYTDSEDEEDDIRYYSDDDEEEEDGDDDGMSSIEDHDVSFKLRNGEKTK